MLQNRLWQKSAVCTLNLVLGIKCVPGTYFWSQNMHLIGAYISIFVPQMTSGSSDLTDSATSVLDFPAVLNL